MSDFIIYFNIFGEFDNFKDWDAAQEKEKSSIVAPAMLLVNACRRELFRSAVTCKRKTSRF